MADKNQPSTSEKNPPSTSKENEPHLKLSRSENSLMHKRLNRIVEQWEKQRDLAAKSKKEEITKNDQQ